MSVQTPSVKKQQERIFAGDKSNGVLMKVHFSDLLLLNFEISEDVVRPHIPAALDLARYNDNCFVSLVAKRVSKVTYGRFILPLLPYCALGLRVCVQRKVDNQMRMGIFYLQEYVQRKSAAMVSNWFYQVAPKVMRVVSENSGFHESDPAVMPSATYRWKIQDRWNKVRVSGHSRLPDTEKLTKEKFVLGCRNLYYRRKNELCECFTEHPHWITWGAASGSFDCDTETLFGREFVKPLKRRPASVFLAKGSEVTVFRPSIVKPEYPDEEIVS